MLTDIQLRTNYVEDVIKERKRLLRNPSLGLAQRVFLEKSIENTKAITNITDLFSKSGRGIYKGLVYDSYIENITGMNFVPYESGVADNIRQVKSHFNELEDSNKKFVLIFNDLNKSIGNTENIENLGKYIGDKEKPILEEAIYFNIFILEEEAKVS